MNNRKFDQLTHAWRWSSKEALDEKVQMVERQVQEGATLSPEQQKLLERMKTELERL